MKDIKAEIMDRADEIALEMYNKHWDKLPHDQQDEVMEHAESEVQGVGLEYQDLPS
tara:strand:- start:713 stop:880 length:168 start_codon:yes stop_codon:yes gene_type:complete